MDHEVFVPVPAESVRRVLRDPERAARCVPGLQLETAEEAEAAAGPEETGAAVTGRLKVRVGSHTITYRGRLRIAERDGVFTVEGEGTEARGPGAVKAVLTVRVRDDAAGGAVLGFAGTAQSEGRLAGLPDASREQAARRLLDRFAEAVAAYVAEGGAAADGIGGPDDATASGDAGDAGEPDEVDGGAEGDGEAAGSGYDTPVPPPGFGDGLHELGELNDLNGLDDLNALGEPGDGSPDEPLAEAAHARRTMIGRSAEEVDHAPPRGRYAPRPAPDTGSRKVPVRWAAGAVAVGSALLLARALRRRRA
ncbi:SRPBCC domain-containing protein [Streptomyces qinzhouensis]|uniref:Carbon monoxide dehydrogenase n=1 Tax=Streptomyces qinzhouensis TaxID=2599401 RepID=A0A5B8J871_9ACTN|nr:SRPBCC domain-containing protein [Streptomyces qinzhouensis]QDY78035.1 carbon monoxide dehydrogenase [Streptomyces qinzhouensis]